VGFAGYCLLPPMKIPGLFACSNVFSAQLFQMSPDIGLLLSLFAGFLSSKYEAVGSGAVRVHLFEDLQGEQLLAVPPCHGCSQLLLPI